MKLIAERLYLEMERIHHDLALALVDRRGIVQDLSGSWSRLGYLHLGIGHSIDDHIEALVGIFPTDQLSGGLHMPLIARPDGHYIDIAVDDSNDGILVTAKDVTESGHSRQEVIHARNQMRLTNAALETVADELGQAMSALRRYHMIYEHEVRNAAQVVQASLTMLRRNVPELRSSPYLQAASGSTMALVDALNAALEVERALFSHSKTNVVPAHIVHELAREFGPLAQMKALEFRTVVGHGAEAAVNLEPFRLRLILVNLLANAVKYTDHGHISLAVTANDQKGELTFTVKDTGPGLDHGVLAAIDSQFSSPTTVPVEGSGLGLFICNHLTRSMHGRLEAASYPGKGSSVRLIFPTQTGQGPI